MQRRQLSLPWNSVELHQPETDGILNEAYRLMPLLLDEMREDVGNDSTKLVREFAVLRSNRAGFSSTKPRFVYFAEQHPDLQLQVDWLEEMGLVLDVTPSNVPIYRMTAELVDWLHAPRHE